MKAVITAGGYATRWLPLSRGIPKEMVPLGNKPVIDYIVSELHDAGVTDVLFLIGRGRECVMNYFDAQTELDLPPLYTDMRFYYRRVPYPKGVADCIKHARDFVGNDAFVLAYCDDVFFEGNPTKEMIDKYKANHHACLTATRVPMETAHTYGIIDAKGVITEKPEKPATNMAAVGRYLITPDFWDVLEGDNIAALNKLPNKNIIDTKARRFDTGTPKTWFEAVQYIFSQN